MRFILATKTASSATLPGNAYPHLVKPNLPSFPAALFYLASNITNSDDITICQSIRNIINITQIHNADNINNTPTLGEAKPTKFPW